MLSAAYPPVPWLLAHAAHHPADGVAGDALDTTSGFPFSTSPVLLLGFLSVCVAVALLVRLVVRYRATPQASGHLSVRAQLALSPAHTVYVVSVQDRQLLLGASSTGLVLLADLTARGLVDPAEALDRVAAHERPLVPLAGGEPR